MLLSRTADALYWLNRYLERAEHTARLISVRLDLGLDRLPGTDQWDFQRVHDSLRIAARDAHFLSALRLLSVTFR